jgi:hypothetical protein
MCIIRPTPLTDSSEKENKVAINVSSNPRRENPVSALCGIAIGPRAPTTEPQDQLAGIRFCRCADNALRVFILVLSSMSVVLRLLVILSLMTLFLVLLEVPLSMVGPLVRLNFLTLTSLMLREHSMTQTMMRPFTAILRTVVLRQFQLRKVLMMHRFPQRAEVMRTLIAVRLPPLPVMASLLMKTGLVLLVFLGLSSPCTCGRCPTTRPKTQQDTL